MKGAIAAPYRPLSRELFNLVFGAKLAPLLHEAEIATPMPHPGFDTITPEQARMLVGEFIKKASIHPLLKGLIDLSKLEVRYTEEPTGFAEYWPLELTPGRTRDLLIIHLNGQ